MDIGKRIKKIRSDKGLTQKQLAKIAGIGEMTISQYERGVRQPKVEQLQRIVNVLGISMNQLLTDSAENFAPKKLREIAKEGHTDYFIGGLNDNHIELFMDAMNAVVAQMDVYEKIATKYGLSKDKIIEILLIIGSMANTLNVEAETLFAIVSELYKYNFVKDGDFNAPQDNP